MLAPCCERDEKPWRPSARDQGVSEPATPLEDAWRNDLWSSVRAPDRGRAAREANPYGGSFCIRLYTIASASPTQLRHGWRPCVAARGNLGLPRSRGSPRGPWMALTVAVARPFGPASPFATARLEAVRRGSGQPWLAPQPRKPAGAMDGPAGALFSAGASCDGNDAARRRPRPAAPCGPARRPRSCLRTHARSRRPRRR